MTDNRCLRLHLRHCRSGCSGRSGCRSFGLRRSPPPPPPPPPPSLPDVAVHGGGGGGGGGGDGWVIDGRDNNDRREGLGGGGSHDFAPFILLQLSGGDHARDVVLHDRLHRAGRSGSPRRRHRPGLLPPPARAPPPPRRSGRLLLLLFLHGGGSGLLAPRLLLLHFLPGDPPGHGRLLICPSRGLARGAQRQAVARAACVLIGCC